jgi:hypothetical protein
MKKRTIKRGEKVKGLYFDPLKIFEVSHTNESNDPNFLDKFKVIIRDEGGYSHSSKWIDLSKSVKKVK